MPPGEGGGANLIDIEGGQNKTQVISKYQQGHMGIGDIDMLRHLIMVLRVIQSGASSCAKHGGAYFSAVRGSVKDPIAVPGRDEVQEC